MEWGLKKKRFHEVFKLRPTSEGSHASASLPCLFVQQHLELLQLRLPEPIEVVDPFLERVEALLPQDAVPFLADILYGDESGGVERLDVLRDGGSAHVEVIGERVYRHRVAREEPENLAPARIGYSLKRIHGDTSCFRFCKQRFQSLPNHATPAVLHHDVSEVILHSAEAGMPEKELGSRILRGESPGHNGVERDLPLPRPAFP